jgi:hypothetical protein
VNAVLECRRCDLRLTRKNAHMLELACLGVQADAYLCVEGTQKHEPSIEFTAVVPSQAEMKRKIEGYERLFPDHPIPVLWLTTSRSKLNQLRKSLSESSYK